MGSTRARIAIDAMGGDNAPAEIVAGALRAQQELGVEVLLVGDRDRIEATSDWDGNSSEIEIVPAEGVVEMDEEALSALKRKPKASIAVAMKLVKEKRADAVVSAGHSGAAMAAALLRLGRLPGIDRPAIGAVFPTRVPGKSAILLDAGANVDCRPKFLEQFGLMGTIYSQHVLGVPEPKVGLLNIGEEATKGDELTVRTYELLDENPHIPFIGNAEGRDVLSGRFDVVVCDGFVGNVLLKFAESTGEVVMRTIEGAFKQAIINNPESEINLKPLIKQIKDKMDPEERGGGLLLGVAGICIISHGSSKAPSIFNAIRLAKDAVEHQVLERIQRVQKEVIDN